MTYAELDRRISHTRIELAAAVRKASNMPTHSNCMTVMQLRGHLAALQVQRDEMKAQRIV